MRGGSIGVEAARVMWARRCASLIATPPFGPGRAVLYASPAAFYDIASISIFVFQVYRVYLERRVSVRQTFTSGNNGDREIHDRAHRRCVAQIAMH